MDLNADSLVAQLADRPAGPLYLVAGNEPLLVIEACDAIRAAARAMGCTERLVFDVAATVRESKSDSDKLTVWGEIRNALDAPGLFSPLRLIEIRLPTGRPGTEGAKFLESLANDPVPGVIVLVIADEWSRKHGGKWSDAIRANGKVCMAWPVKLHDLTTWLDKRLRRHQLNLDREALQIIADRVEGNLLAARQEVEKLALLTGGKPTSLNAEQTRSLVVDLARFDVFRLTEAAWNGQATQALRMLEGLRQEGAVVPALMGMIVLELTTTADVAQGLASGGDMGQLFRARNVWEAKQPMYRRALQRHPAARWQRFLIHAGRIDRISKGRESGDAWVELQRLIAAVATPNGGQLLATQLPSASRVVAHGSTGA